MSKDDEGNPGCLLLFIGAVVAVYLWTSVDALKARVDALEKAARAKEAREP